jgi:hypothetical protein
MYVVTSGLACLNSESRPAHWANSAKDELKNPERKLVRVRLPLPAPIF